MAQAAFCNKSRLISIEEKSVECAELLKSGRIRSYQSHACGDPLRSRRRLVAMIVASIYVSIGYLLTYIPAARVPGSLFQRTVNRAVGALAAVTAVGLAPFRPAA